VRSLLHSMIYGKHFSEFCAGAGRLRPTPTEAEIGHKPESGRA